MTNREWSMGAVGVVVGALIMAAPTVAWRARVDEMEAQHREDQAAVHRCIVFLDSVEPAVVAVYGVAAWDQFVLSIPERSLWRAHERRGR